MVTSKNRIERQAEVNIVKEKREAKIVSDNKTA